MSFIPPLETLNPGRGAAPGHGSQVRSATGLLQQGLLALSSARGEGVEPVAPRPAPRQASTASQRLDGSSLGGAQLAGPQPRRLSPCEATNATLPATAEPPEAAGAEVGEREVKPGVFEGYWQMKGRLLSTFDGRVNVWELLTRHAASNIQPLPACVPGRPARLAQMPGMAAATAIKTMAMVLEREAACPGHWQRLALVESGAYEGCINWQDADNISKLNIGEKCLAGELAALGGLPFLSHLPSPPLAAHECYGENCWQAMSLLLTDTVDAGVAIASIVKEWLAQYEESEGLRPRRIRAQNWSTVKKIVLRAYYEKET